MIPFEQASYLAQVRRLRALAENAVALYPVRVRRLEFLQHGENATFRVDAADGRRYLLRLHRPDYHHADAIGEELRWLSLLAKRGLRVPAPLRSRRGRLLETATHPSVTRPRHCGLFHWIDGRFIEKSLSPAHLHDTGRLLARLQTIVPRGEVRHRRYWTADGLAGPAPKFGPIDRLTGVPAGAQRRINEGRATIHRALRAYERKFPARRGLIHADLHFGNLLATREGLAAIDFDDCGFGFHVYDLVPPLLSAANILGAGGRDRLPEMKAALIDGYRSGRPWDSNDANALEHLIGARRLMMLGWLNSRSDNPRLRKHLPGAVERALKHLEK